MKLSDAIRLGAMLKPQGFNAVHADGKTCAFGAAYEAIGIAGSDETDPAMFWPWLDAAAPKCPACGEQPTRMKVPFIIASHLNDYHRWTREQIADWVETIEAQHEQAPQPAPVDVEA